MEVLEHFWHLIGWQSLVTNISEILWTEKCQTLTPGLETAIRRRMQS